MSSRAKMTDLEEVLRGALAIYQRPGGVKRVNLSDRQEWFLMKAGVSRETLEAKRKEGRAEFNKWYDDVRQEAAKCLAEHEDACEYVAMVLPGGVKVCQAAQLLRAGFPLISFNSFTYLEAAATLWAYRTGPKSMRRDLADVMDLVDPEPAKKKARK